MPPRKVNRVAKDMASLVERDGLRCVYCSVALALPLEQAGTTEEEWEAAGWELSLTADEPVWQFGTAEAPAHRDHVVPVSKGGPDHINNLVLSCAACNMEKKARPLLLFFALRAGCPRFKSVGDVSDHFPQLRMAG